MIDNRKRIREIGRELSELNAKSNALANERDTLTLEMQRSEHPCACVKLGHEIGIHDCGALQRANRTRIGLGLVSYTLSADNACPMCRGTGKPS